MKITVETYVPAPLDWVWRAWTTADDIVRWNAVTDDWHTTTAVDLRVGGTFSSRMEAKDGSMGLDFAAEEAGVRVRETLDAEATNPMELQRQGWQAILDNFGRYVEAGWWAALPAGRADLIRRIVAFRVNDVTVAARARRK